MSEVWYRVPRRASSYGDSEPTAVEVERSTDKFIIYKSGQRSAKRSDYQCYFKTEFEAKRHILNSLLDLIDSATERAEYAKKEARMYHEQLAELSSKWDLAVGMEGVK